MNGVMQIQMAGVASMAVVSDPRVDQSHSARGDLAELADAESST